MLYLTTEIGSFHSFLEVFQKRNESLQFIDLSKVSSDMIATECDSIVNHHKECYIFLGYIEPGWMLEPTHQTRIRKLIRKFPVGLVLQYPESLTYSWKNEIDIIYTENGLKKYGESNIIHHGSTLHN